MAKRIVSGILAHVDAGKTTLLEALLYESGTVRSPGSVDRKNSNLDTWTQEKDRGITIFSKQTVLNFGGVEFSFLDTPGHVDLSAETERTLAVLDACVLVIDATTGASFTSRSVRAMAAAALNTAAGKDPSGMNGGDLPAEGTLGSEDFSENEVICRVYSNIDSSAYVYKCSAKGFEGTNKATITVNKDKGTIVSVAVDEFGDTTGVGDAATADAELAKFEGASLDSAIDATSGASLTSKSLRAMAAAALQAAGN